MESIFMDGKQFHGLSNIEGKSSRDRSQIKQILKINFSSPKNSATRKEVSKSSAKFEEPTWPGLEYKRVWIQIDIFRNMEIGELTGVASTYLLPTLNSRLMVIVNGRIKICSMHYEI